MKRFIILLAALTLVWSCATAPKTPENPPIEDKPPVETKPIEETKPVEKPVEKPVDLPPEALLAKAKELKKTAFDLALFEIMPDEYKTADASLAEGSSTYGKDNAASKKSLEEAVAKFDELIAKGTELLSAKRRDQADSMKTAALKTRAFELYPEMTGKADAAYAEADAQAGKGDHALSTKSFELARSGYEIAMKKAQAQDLRDRISELDFARYDEGNHATAEKKFAEIGAFDDPAKSVDAADEALLRYNLVMRKGFEYTAGVSKEKTDAQKRKSEEVKAEVAVKDEYATAKAVYDEGIAKMKEGDFEGAAEKFAAAEPMFAQAYETAAEKREKALEAMRALELKKATSEQKAKDAAEEIGGSK